MQALQYKADKLKLAARSGLRMQFENGKKVEEGRPDNGQDCEESRNCDDLLCSKDWKLER